MVISMIRLMIGVLPAIGLAYLFFDFNLFSLGLPLAAFFANLVFFAWAIGLAANGLVVRYGLGAESIVWIAVFAILPLSCVYYPLATLPEWLQYVAAAMPSTQVFEGLRSLVIDGTFRPTLMINALALNVVYFSAAFLIFLHFLRQARIKGTLMQLGE
jgi:ABC-2 type transport system permease protein